jgi:hypothetical protein
MARRNKNELTGSNIRLSRKQIGLLMDVMNSLPNVSSFDINEEYGSGIGTNVYVHFNLFNKFQDVLGAAMVDITDVDSW